MLNYRLANEKDLEALMGIEVTCFDSDRLSLRRFKHWIRVDHGILMVCQENDQVVGYGLVWCHKGTRLARLYSLAVLPQHRGKNIAEGLLTRLEEAASKRGHISMRLEVSENNTGAIKLYERLDYRIFDEYTEYYEDHSDALRMQKSIHKLNPASIKKPVPWYQQTTEFTCGPAALMMAMASQKETLQPNQALELDIWRQATSIFMTSGHGGTHPFGLALAANDQGFQVELFINTQATPFLEGVRSSNKKDILEVVHEQFKQRVESRTDIKLHYQDTSQDQVEHWLNNDYAVLVLISTYRLDGRKAPHWVAVTHIDEHCLYVHDPDCEASASDDRTSNKQGAIDCQHVPIARADFDKMSAFGASKLRTAIAIKSI
jgi:ribosomal protein S18 acetylase RimI-like enzyme